MRKECYFVSGTDVRLLWEAWRSRRTKSTVQAERRRKELAMTFDEVLAQVWVLLEREGRVSYRALKRSKLGQDPVACCFERATK
jgi:hypothetical protein